MTDLYPPDPTDVELNSGQLAYLCHYHSDCRTRLRNDSRLEQLLENLDWRAALLVEAETSLHCRVGRRDLRAYLRSRGVPGGEASEAEVFLNCVAIGLIRNYVTPVEQLRPHHLDLLVTRILQNGKEQP